MNDYTARSALVVVDMQHDFADPSGSLYVPGGEDTIAPIAAELVAATAAGALVVFTQDWHPEHTPHFAMDGGIWPVHCVMGTQGAALVPGLLPDGQQPDQLIRKGSGPQDGYSGFSVLDLASGVRSSTELPALLATRDIHRVTVVGLAGDWCVKATAIDAAELGYQTSVPLALTRFVELQPGDTARAVTDMRDAGVTVI